MQTQAMTVGLYCKQKVVRCRLQERHVMEEEERQQRKSTKRSIAEEMECNVEHLESIIMVKKALQPLRCSPILSNILPKFACTVRNLLDIVACNLVTFYNLKSNLKTYFVLYKKVDSLQRVQSEWQKTRVGMLRSRFVFHPILIS